MAAVTNRLRQHFAPDEPTPEPTAEERQRFVAEAVARAMSAAVRLLDHDDPKVVLKAAAMLLDLEKTRLRHGRAVLEPTLPTPPPAPVAEAEPEPEPPKAEPFPTPETHPERFYMRDEPWMHDMPVGGAWRRPCFIPQIPPDDEWDNYPKPPPFAGFTREPDVKLE
jgi:hypothetical protein